MIAAMEGGSITTGLSTAFLLNNARPAIGPPGRIGARIDLTAAGLDLKKMGKASLSSDREMVCI